MSFEALEALIGKRVLEVKINPSNDLLQFVTDQGTHFFKAVGDCCSTSWIEHFNNLIALQGQIVVDVNEVNKGEDPDDKRDECVDVYIYQLLTEKGVVEIEMRNGSNGYYCGWIKEISEKDLLLENQNFLDLKPLLADF